MLCEDQFKHLEIPETWDSVLAFSYWWFDHGMPHMPPAFSQIHVSDNASAFCIFRHSVFQIEQYMIFPDTEVFSHSHPGVDTIQVITSEDKATPTNKDAGFRGMNSTWGRVIMTPAGEFHGAGDKKHSRVGSCGISMYVFEQWPEGAHMTSAAAAWRGKVHGPAQEALINKYYPGVIDSKGHSYLSEKDIMNYKPSS